MYAHNKSIDKLMTAISHHKIREDLLTRIQSGEWALGGLIPGETQLAEDYGCARTTVNRALRTLAEQGLVIRKRKGGTRICQTPVRQAKLDIPIIREQVEGAGKIHTHEIIKQNSAQPPKVVQARLNLKSGAEALYLETRHLADGQPFAFETRWLNTDAVPNFDTAPLSRISVNEWLVQTVPFSSGDVAFSAVTATAKIANAMECDTSDALFLIDRTTWLGDVFITTLKLYYHPGFQLYSKL